MRINFIVFICMIIFGFITSVNAAFHEPEEILRSNFGSGDLEVGYEENQYGYVGGDLIGIAGNGNIVIGDGINKRIKIYSVDGVLKKNIFAQEISLSSLGGWPTNLKVGEDGILTLRIKFQKYGIDGALIFSIDQQGYRNYWVARSGYVYLETPQKKFKKYSPTGELLATYDKKPLELGIKTARRRAGIDNKYDATVRFEDITYHMILDGDWDQFVRDRNDYLYFYNSYTAKDPVSGEDSSTSLVVKYDACGKKIGELHLPISEYEPPTQEELDRPTTRLTVRNEYGPPVIGPDGSVYAWKRTPTPYSILKWAWIDSPDDPKGGPDAPADLKVLPSTNGLYLTWTASPQDPGCVEGYEVERSSTASGIFSNLTTTSPGVVKYNDTGAFAGSTYYYRVRAKSTCGPSSYTAEVSGKRP